MGTFTLYCLMMLDSFKSAISNIEFCLLLGLGIYGMIFLLKYFNTECEWGDAKERCKKNLRSYVVDSKKYIVRAIITLFALIFINGAIPSSEKMAVIYLVPKMMDNVQLQKIGKNSLDILEKYTEKYLNNLATKVEGTEEKKK